GGHSLNATQMAYKIHQTFDMQIPLGELLSNPTITEIAALIDFIGWEGMQAHTLDNKENMVEVLL
ncbi:MAG: hypothetical protein GY757_32470, partial [bacterium]|nr:hypothetical protein [bacterium]